MVVSVLQVAGQDALELIVHMQGICTCINFANEGLYLVHESSQAANSCSHQAWSLYILQAVTLNVRNSLSALSGQSVRLAWNL